MTLKKLKLNIKYISSKTKKCYKYNLTSLLKKLIKLPKPKHAKGKKYYKKGYKIGTQIYNALALN